LLTAYKLQVGYIIEYQKSAQKAGVTLPFVMTTNPTIQLFALTKNIINNIPPHQQLSANDADVIHRARDFLAGLEDALVQGFYDTMYHHSPMRVIIDKGVRTDREQTLRTWWQRTLAGPFDDKYWAWQALVGMVHVKAGVKNQMMLSMWAWSMAWLREQLKTSHLDKEHADYLLQSFERLALTAQSLTVESYIDNYLQTVVRMTGFKPALMERMAATEIGKMIAEARAELGTI
jgi:hypothetical protein